MSPAAQCALAHPLELHRERGRHARDREGYESPERLWLDAVAAAGQHAKRGVQVIAKRRRVGRAQPQPPVRCGGRRRAAARRVGEAAGARAWARVRCGASPLPHAPRGMPAACAAHAAPRAPARARARSRRGEVQQRVGRRAG
jgi:hypothetical protein